jgi:hypothetical protein
MRSNTKVYIGRLPSGAVLCDTDINVLKAAGAEVLASLPLGDFQNIGHHSVSIAIEEGVPAIRLTEGAKKAVRKKRILSRLDEIDRLRVRPLSALANGEDNGDRDYLAKYNAEAEALRTELAEL